MKNLSKNSNDLYNISGYRYSKSGLNDSHSFLLPTLFHSLKTLNLSQEKHRLFELGCGNGSVAYQLAQIGFEITGVDPSVEGIAQAKHTYPDLNLHLGSAYDDLMPIYGQFPIVISLEVVEHVFFPRKYASTLFDLVEPGGVAILSTPYHGYFKNLVMAVMGKMDNHFTALWDYGHIKFWSVKTMTQLLTEAGFSDITFMRVGRFLPALAKSMIVMAKKS